jgi:hypothetical protein
MKLFIHNELTGFNAMETTSFLRADLFIIIDDILSRPYQVKLHFN